MAPFRASAREVVCAAVPVVLMIAAACGGRAGAGDAATIDSGVGPGPSTTGAPSPPPPPATGPACQDCSTFNPACPRCPGIGDRCSRTGQCEPPGECGKHYVCERPCTHDATCQTEPNHYCSCDAAGRWSDAAAPASGCNYGHCVWRKRSNDPCLLDGAQTAEANDCEGPLHCALDTHVCTAPSPPAAPCLFAADCASGVCACPDAGGGPCACQ
jgi:hypothetical protein